MIFARVFFGNPTLLEPITFETFLATLETELPQILRVGRVKLVLESHEAADPALDQVGQVLTVVEPGFVSDYMSQGRALRRVTLRQTDGNASLVFGRDAGWVQSEACLLLDFGDGRLPGMLAMGADNALQFQATQGTDLLDFMAELQAVGGRADKTRDAYRADVLGFLGFLQSYEGGGLGRGALAVLTTRKMRAWMAHERGRGLSARSLARALSAVKSFVRWVAERDGFDATPVLMTRSPRFTAKLPRPLQVDAARAVLDTVEAGADKGWVGARDMAVLALLYGCGLRISEALSLTGADSPLPASLRIVGKGGKERIVPVLPAARTAVERYMALCPFEIAERDAIFRGVRGGA